MSSELELARLLRDQRDRTARRASSGSGSPAWLGRVTTATATVAVGKFLMARPVALLGDESEGSAGSATDLGTVDTPVYLVGGSPAQNDQVVVQWSDYRWVTSRRGSATNGIPILVTGCQSAPVTFEAVTATKGGTTVTGTTDGSGYFYLPSGSTGGWTFTTATLTATQTIPFGGTGPYSPPFTARNTAGWGCSCPNMPIATSSTFTVTGAASASLAWSPTFKAWIGSGSNSGPYFQWTYGVISIRYTTFSAFTACSITVGPNGGCNPPFDFYDPAVPSFVYHLA